MNMKKNYSSFSADNTIQSIVFNAMQDDNEQEHGQANGAGQNGHEKVKSQTHSRHHHGHANNSDSADDDKPEPAVSESIDDTVATSDDETSDEPPAEESAAAMSTTSSDFDLFEDDEAWLQRRRSKTSHGKQEVSSGSDDTDDGTIDRTSDFVLNEEDDSAAVKQDEGILTWEMLGVYNEEGETHRKTYLRENPPILLVESSQGEEVSIILTRELTRTLSKSFGDLEKAYYGHRRSRGDARGLLGGKTPAEWFAENPLRGGATVLIVFVFFAVLVLNLFG